ncbi:methyltransferase domain-containing protein [Amycolatopsis vastitatis]|uniref:Protein-L-isoaspartate O-methyltransferase n=1 Tax=Amycolatopsis vastitatis TaxID=1905142 RepID=A0A229TEE7_9PSEU|nr:methyltransferase domain-containing protein [Amycolatopsis vastitatis]OXM69616.1 protein-L-isoaspartate carboxylmethyltransferase [Amycolatopsis vastitatis]
MTTTASDWTKYARGLADLMQERGDIVSPAWHAAVAGVPRHTFVQRAYEQDNTGQWMNWETSEHWDRVYATRTLVTALDSRRGYPEPSSSSTNPELMVRMLEMLDIHDGYRVLEIGTGTGYNAALLSHRLGDARVFSVDIDPELVTLAGQRLSSAGFRPTLAAVDGQAGLPEHAPYDRIISTCSVPAVPASWAGQLASGGAVLVDLKLAISAGNLVHLHRQDDGALEGRFATRWASFMAMRHENDESVSVPRVEETDGGRSYTTAAPVPPWNSPVVWFLAQLGGLPREVEFGVLLDPETRQPYAASLAAPDGSWTRVNLADQTVTEAGSTSLWEPVEWANRLWTEASQPGWERLGLTVDTHGENTVWLDEPDGEHRWTIAGS